MNRETLIKIVEEESTNPNLEGAECNVDDSVVFDRRYSPEAVKQLGLNPRTADLNIIGQVVVCLTEEEVYKLNLKDK